MALALVSGCFEPIIKDPGATAGEGSTSSGGAMSSGGESSTASSTSTSTTSTTSAASSGSSTVDADKTSTAGREEPTPFFCDPTALCAEAWKVEPCEECAALTSLGECILKAQAQRSPGYVEVIRCDPGCRVERITVRGGDTSDAIREVATLDGEGAIVSVAPPERCKLEAVAYFEGCVAAYTPACADSAAWLVACEPFSMGECPLS